MMKEFDGKIYYPYTDECKKEVIKKLEKYYPQDQIESIMNNIHLKYMDYLEKFNRDLGGKKNSRNGVSGTYDCIFLFCVYEVCQDQITKMDLEGIENALLIPTFEKLNFINLSNPIYKRLYHLVLYSVCKKGNRIDDYHAEVEPYEKNQPIRYHFTSCPIAEFAKEFGFEGVIPYLCNADYTSIELMNAKLVRKNTLGNGSCCDYAIYSKQDSHLKDHEEYRDEQGYIRNH